MDQLKAKSFLTKRKQAEALEEEDLGFEVNFSPLKQRKKLKRSKMHNFRDPKNFISNTPSTQNVRPPLTSSERGSKTSKRSPAWTFTGS